MASIGPSIPAHLINPTQDSPLSEPQSRLNPQHVESSVDNGDTGDDGYAPELPPDLVHKPKISATPRAPPSRVLGPSMPPGLSSSSRDEADDSDDDDVGPQPLPVSLLPTQSGQVDGVRHFKELEEKRRKNTEEAAKPKALQRDEWMLVPPTASEVLGNIDPTRLKSRTFAKSSGPDRSRTDNTLWTETPQQRQQRIEDEVAGKKRRAVNADTDALSQDELIEMRKRRRVEDDIRKGVERHTRAYRGEALVEAHSKNQPDDDPKAHLIWDHERDMSLGGRLMDDSQRTKLLKDAKGLGDRFGSGQSGGFL